MVVVVVVVVVVVPVVVVVVPDDCGVPFAVAPLDVLPALSVAQIR